MVLYQLESLHLDDYNLIYSQNKNMGLVKILTAFPLKTQHFPFTNITQNQSNQQYSSKLKPTQPQNSFATKTKLFLSTFGVFPNIKITKDEARVLFSYLNLFFLFSPLHLSKTGLLKNELSKTTFWSLSSFKCKAMFGLPHLFSFSHFFSLKSLIFHKALFGH